MGSDYAYGLAIDGDYCYVGYDQFGLACFDISDPKNIIYLGKYDTSYSARGLEVYGEHIYVADVQDGYYEIDIKDYTSPNQVGQISSISYPVQ